MQTAFLRGKTVLITGGTGSLGTALVHTLLHETPCKKIIVFSRDEFKQHEMRQRFPDPEDRLRFFLGDVRDLARLERAFAGVEMIVHAAALKQVPALEYNPLEAVKTNVLGTQNVIDAALNTGVAKVLLVSTDKAVNPNNLYGATKLCAEKLLVAANAYGRKASPTRFSVVRYGNVVGSRGSIVELLEGQKASGVVTLTHKDMTRFLITVEEGVTLVLNGLRVMKGGEIFVPKLRAMKIRQLISVVAPTCTVKIIGARPGEKIHEVLLTEDEVRRSKDLGSCYVVEPHHEWWDTVPLRRFASLPVDFQYTSDTVEPLRSEDFLRYLSR